MVRVRLRVGVRVRVRARLGYRVRLALGLGYLTVLARVELGHRTAGAAPAAARRDNRGDELGGEVTVGRDELADERGRAMRVGKVAAVEPEHSAARCRSVRVGDGGGRRLRVEA